MLLEAAADFLRKRQIELDIIGDGPQRPLLEAMVERLGIQSSVRFRGWLPYVEVQNRLRTCDFMALPSVREFGGGVVVEAMALGVTPIVADYAGPSELVDDKTGIRVPFHDDKSLVEEPETGNWNYYSRSGNIGQTRRSGTRKSSRDIDLGSKGKSYCRNL